MRTSADLHSAPGVAESLPAADAACHGDEMSPALWRMLERTLREGRMSRGAIEAELFQAAFDGTEPR
jgi:hypothetical protein